MRIEKGRKKGRGTMAYRKRTRLGGIAMLSASGVACSEGFLNRRKRRFGQDAQGENNETGRGEKRAR